MPKHLPLPPIDELRKRLAYRSDGVLVWKRVKGQSAKPGHVAGSSRVYSSGYFQVTINNRKYLVHRIVWAIIKREDPLGLQIDHINGDKSDNRIENLRKATHMQNMRNLSHAKGCYFNPSRGKWQSTISLLNKNKFLGRFDTKEQAREAYLRAKEKLHGEFMPSDMKHELGQIDGPTSQLDLFND